MPRQSDKNDFKHYKNKEEYFSPIMKHLECWTLYFIEK